MSRCSRNLEVLLTRDSQTKAALPRAAADTAHFLEVTRCKASCQAVAVLKGLGQAALEVDRRANLTNTRHDKRKLAGSITNFLDMIDMTSAVTSLLPTDAFDLGAPTEFDLTKCAAGHVLLTPINQPVAGVALCIRALDPDAA